MNQPYQYPAQMMQTPYGMMPAPPQQGSGWVSKVLLVIVLIAPVAAGVTWAVMVEIRMNALQRSLDDGVKKDMAELRTQMVEYRKSVDATREQLAVTAGAMSKIAEAMSTPGSTPPGENKPAENKPPR